MVQLIIDPVDEDSDELFEFGVVKGSGLDHGALLVFLQLVLLGWHFSGLGHSFKMEKNDVK